MILHGGEMDQLSDTPCSEQTVEILHFLMHEAILRMGCPMNSGPAQAIQVDLDRPVHLLQCSIQRGLQIGDGRKITQLLGVIGKR